jgi:hypothetical protein
VLETPGTAVFGTAVFGTAVFGTAVFGTAVFGTASNVEQSARGQRTLDISRRVLYLVAIEVILVDAGAEQCRRPVDDACAYR